MMLNNLVTITFSEKEKKIIVIVLLIILLIVLFVGILNRLVMKWYKHESAKIDSYLTGYVKYGFAEDEKKFRSIGRSKNNAIFFHQSLIGIILLAVSVPALIIFTSANELEWTYIFDIYYGLLPKFDMEMTTIFGAIPCPAEWPHLTENCFVLYSDKNGIFAYVFAVVFLAGALIYMTATFKRMARGSRISKKAKELFRGSLDTLDTSSTTGD